MKIREIEEKYRDEWVLVEVLKEDESGEPTEVKMIAHSRNRDDTYAAMRKARGKYTVTTQVPPFATNRGC